MQYQVQRPQQGNSQGSVSRVQHCVEKVHRGEKVVIWVGGAARTTNVNRLGNSLTHHCQMEVFGWSVLSISTAWKNQKHILEFALNIFREYIAGSPASSSDITNGLWEGACLDHPGGSLHSCQYIGTRSYLYVTYCRQQTPTPEVGAMWMGGVSEW